MTPSQLEHLKLIDAHLERLLAIAEKRTLGEWGNAVNQVGQIQDHCGIADCCYREDAENDANAAFIAACAGNAEAGWTATRAAIAIALNQESWDYMINQMYIRQDAEEILKAILASFPLESLK